MAHSFCKIYVHVIFSAKNRQCWLDEVKEYIDGQIEYHHHQTFQEEFRGFLDRYGIEYDERYIWE